MKRLKSIFFAIAILWTGNHIAQSVTQGGLTGTLVSAVLENASSLTTIYTTPAKGHFALTQLGSTNGFCSYTIPGLGRLPVNDLPPSNQPSITFGPGLLLPANTAISAFGSGCYIIGVLEK